MANEKESGNSKPTEKGRSLKRCRCDVCFCGTNCQCTEALCRCEASSVLNSLSGNSRNSTPGTSTCCGGRSKAPEKDTDVDPSKPLSLDAPPSSKPPASTGSLQTYEIGVKGMTCTMCTSAVEKALIEVAGVASASVSLATHSAYVEYDPSVVEKQELLDTIEDIGYDVVVPDPTLSKAVAEIGVGGMTCTMCSQAIVRALEALEGVHEVSVSLTTNLARVEYDTSIVQVDDLKDAIEAVGYEVTGENIQEQDETEDRLERLLHQQEAQVKSRKSAFLWSLLGTTPILIMTMVLPHIPCEALDKILLQQIHVGKYKFVLEALILWVLCTPIQFGSGWSFYKTSYFGLQQGILGMDVLVATGTSASYGYAVWATLSGTSEYHFFETSAVLICFVLLGKWLQTMAVRRTSQALTQLLALQPKTAIQVIPPAGANLDDRNWNPFNDSYQEQVVPLHSITKGDMVKVLKGASIPADGVIRFGEMSVDESMITGESIPVLKTEGSIVLGGTICAESGQAAGAAFVEVTGVGSSTALSQIVKLVQEAQNRQVPIQNLADTIASYFVSTVVTVSVITFMVWYALCQSEVFPSSSLPPGETPTTFSLLFGLSCLVISCPCALGLATPTAVMVGTGVGAKQGVLMKGGETLELASQVNSVVFDKTGTLTKGKPAVASFQTMVSDSSFWKDVVQTEPGSKSIPTDSARDYMLWLLGSLERNSEHPLAGAIVSYAEDELQGRIPFSQPTDFIALTGRGASGTIDGKTKIAVGNRAFCELNGLEIGKEVEDAMQRLERQGTTAIIASINGKICVVMGIADQLKPDAAASILHLQEKMGVDVWMVTGDNRRTARAIARQLQLPQDRVIAEALPVAKVEQVKKLQEQGRIVAMVGDGVNDSPALAQANVGLGLGAGAEIAAEASDMVLVKGNVADVCTALDLSRVIFRRIQLNFLWSLMYNTLGIPLAAGVLYPLFHARLPPTVAAIAMVLSSISVVASSLALRLYRPPVISQPMTESSTTRRNHLTSRRLVLDGNAELTEPLLQADEATEHASNVSDMEEGQAVVTSV